MTGRERLLLAVLLCGSAMTALVLVVLIPVLPLLAQSFGGGTSGAQLSQAVMTAPALGLIAGGLLSAAAVRMVGTYRLLIAGLVLYGISGSAGYFLSAAPSLLGVRFVLGIAASFVGIASTALIAGRFDSVARAKFLGIKGALGSVGGIGGILIGGYLGSLGGWRLPFLLYAIAFVMLGLAWLTRGEGFVRTDAAREVTPVPAKPAPGLLALWPFYAAIVAFGVVLMMTTTQLSFLLGEIGISDPTAVSRIAVMASVGAMIGGFGYGRLAALIGLQQILPLVFAIWTIGLMMLGFSYSGLVAAIGCSVTGVAAGLFLPHMITTLAETASDEQRDRAIAMLYSAIFLGDFLNPLLIEPMTVVLTRHGAFLAVGGFTLLAFFVSLYRMTRERRRLATG